MPPGKQPQMSASVPLGRRAATETASAVMHDRLPMAKEVQLYMWTSVVARVPRLVGGRVLDGVHVQTRRVPAEAFVGAAA
jgi:hypothetical protein